MSWIEVLRVDSGNLYLKITWYLRLLFQVLTADLEAAGY